MKTNPEPTATSTYTSTYVMKQPPNTTYTVRVLGSTETRISQMEIVNLLFAIEDSLQLEQLYLHYKQEKPLQI